MEINWFLFSISPQQTRWTAFLMSYHPFLQPLSYYSYYFAPGSLFWEESKMKCLLKFWASLLSHPYCTTACSFLFFPQPESIHWHFLKYLLQELTQLFLTINMLRPKELCMKAPVLFAHHFFSLFFLLFHSPPFFVDFLLIPNFLFEVLFSCSLPRAHIHRIFLFLFISYSR